MSKVGTKEETVCHSFTYDSSHKSEITQMVWIDIAVWLRLECAAVLSCLS
jgi:hypothetical protein